MQFGEICTGKHKFILPYISYVFEQIGQSKQCRSGPDATEGGVWSGSLLFVIRTAAFDTSPDGKMDRFNV